MLRGVSGVVLCGARDAERRWPLRKLYAESLKKFRRSRVVTDEESLWADRDGSCNVLLANHVSNSRGVGGMVSKIFLESCQYFQRRGNIFLSVIPGKIFLEHTPFYNSPQKSLYLCIRLKIYSWNTCHCFLLL